MPSLAALEFVPAVVDLGGDPPHHLAVALGEEVLGLGVLEPGVLVAGSRNVAPLEQQRRDPLRVVRPQPERQPDERVEVAAARDRPDPKRHERRQAIGCEAEPEGRSRAPASLSRLIQAVWDTLRMSETRPAVDVFEKARSHDRLEQLEAARAPARKPMTLRRKRN